MSYQYFHWSWAAHQTHLLVGKGHEEPGISIKYTTLFTLCLSSAIENVVALVTCPMAIDKNFNISTS